MKPRFFMMANLLVFVLTGWLLADKCSDDKANVARLNQQLQQDEALLNDWCQNSLSAQCQQEGPGMREAITLLEGEIAAAKRKIPVDCAPPPPPTPVLTVTDVSPDSAYAADVGAGQLGGPGGGGRTYTLVIDPSNNNTVYAVTRNSGVWKSTTAGQSWTQSSTGIQGALAPFYNTLLAVDGNDSQRLLFVSSHDDGRPGPSGGNLGWPHGGLYISLDAAAHWHHAELSAAAGTNGGLCPGNGNDISSVTFVSGKAYVAAPCGLFTNTDPNLADGEWTKLPGIRFATQGALIAPNSYGNTLFVCSGTVVYQLLNPGTPAQTSQSLNLGTGNTCYGLSAVPLTDQLVPNTVAVVHAFAQGKSPAPCTNADVTLVGFGSGLSKSLGFSSVACSGGSGIAAVFTVPRASGGLVTNPVSSAGVDYDVYAADGRFFFVYTPAATASWTPLGGNGGNLHEDSWSMAFPASYDPSTFNCTAYASTDGGIFKNSSLALVYRLIFCSFRVPTGCDPSAGWIASMHNLHALDTFALLGASQTANIAGCQACPTLYQAQGDNDIWVVGEGGTQSAPLDNSLGDAGGVHFDPAYPQQVLVTRGLCAIAAVSGNGSPPLPGAQIQAGNGCGNSTGLAPPNLASAGVTGPGNPTIASVVSTPSQDQVSAPLYLAMQSLPNQPDRIVTASVNPPTSSTWIPIEAGNAAGFFPNGSLLQVAGSGGTVNPVLWVLALNAQSNGQIYRGNLVNGQVMQWNLASGTGGQAIGSGAFLFPNPYNSNYAFVNDLQDQTIKWTSDGGAHWNTVPVLTKMATNNGDYRFGCEISTQTDAFFHYACALAGMSFSRQNPYIAVAALYTGGVAYTRDYGQTWAVLQGVTTALPAGPDAAQNLPGYPISIWYDDNSVVGTPAIYVAMHGGRTVRIDGDFAAFPAN
jgi:hypothetical protein